MRISDWSSDVCSSDLVEEVALLGKGRRCAEAAGDEAGHHLAERGDMIFRLFHVVGARNAQARHVAAQPRQRLLVQKAGVIVGSVGQQLALPDAGEEVEMLLALRLHGGTARRRGPSLPSLENGSAACRAKWRP